MTYHMAFVMAGRYVLWGLLFLSVPFIFQYGVNYGRKKDAQETKRWRANPAHNLADTFWIFGFAFYISVILCARYVQ